MWKAPGAKSWKTPPVRVKRQVFSAKRARGIRVKASMVAEPAVPMSKRNSPPLRVRPG